MVALNNERRGLSTLFAVCDATILLLAAVAAVRIRFGPDFFADQLQIVIEHPGFAAYAIVGLWFLGTTFELYRPAVWRTLDALVVRILALAVIFPTALVLGVYLVPEWRFGRGLLVLTLVIAVPSLALVRMLWFAWGRRPPARRALLIGDGPIVAALLQELEHRPWPPFAIDQRWAGTDAMNQPEDLSAAVDRADLVIVASLAEPDLMARLAALNFRGTQVIDAAGAYAELTGRIPVRQVDSRWFIATGDFAAVATSPFHTVQRGLDLVLAMSILVATSPVLLLAAVAVAATSGFPVLYRQKRLGRFGREFTLVKLRTMSRNAEQEGPAFTEKGDDRVLPVGRLLRRWRIDELPQLLNVLCGDMSLVGPRPERLDVSLELERQIPFYAFRYSVRPGVTGWAQVNLPYCSDLEDHVTKLEHDLWAIRHHGPAMYALVAVRTLGALVFKPGQ
jgi:lipopolysaccharide/colanic/teichoic acid biosynthesis glycosyltransferase